MLALISGLLAVANVGVTVSFFAFQDSSITPTTAVVAAMVAAANTILAVRN